MRFYAIVIFFFTSLPLFSQVEISNKNFNYFDLMEIENNNYQNQLLISATADEIGYNGEWYKINKRYFSLNFSGSYKRLLPNLGQFWAPLTLERLPMLPQNGLSFSFKGKWYFNHRKFSFAGLKLSTGYYWLNDKIMPSYITNAGPSNLSYHVFWARNKRQGLDLIAGRKIVNKLISEIMVEVGFRKDLYEYQFQCASNCVVGGNDEITTYRGDVTYYHFQIILGFNLFSK
jgi:hypothetical protein